MTTRKHVPYAWVCGFRDPGQGPAFLLSFCVSGFPGLSVPVMRLSSESEMLKKRGRNRRGGGGVGGNTQGCAGWSEMWQEEGIKILVCWTVAGDPIDGICLRNTDLVLSCVWRERRRHKTIHSLMSAVLAFTPVAPNAPHMRNIPSSSAPYKVKPLTEQSLRFRINHNGRAFRLHQRHSRTKTNTHHRS